MSTELGILGLYGLFTILTILVQATVAVGQVGLMTALYPRDNVKLAGVAARLDRAQLNSVIALALFAPGALILAHKGITTSTTVLAAEIFLVSRIIYVPAYAFGIPGLRTGVWTLGILATAWLYFAGL